MPGGIDHMPGGTDHMPVLVPLTMPFLQLILSLLCQAATTSKEYFYSLLTS